MNNRGKRQGVTFSKPEEPAFLQRIKQQIGFKEGPTIDTKREELAADDGEDDRADEKPTIVVLKPGDLTAEDVDKLGGIKEDDEEEATSGRIMFKKPIKRNISSSADELKEKIAKIESKDLKNKSLLSFNEEEDDDDEEN